MVVDFREGNDHRKGPRNAGENSIHMETITSSRSPKRRTLYDPCLSYLTCVTALLLITLSCNRTTAPVEGCFLNVDVAVSPEAIPSITWSPTCGMSHLTVTTVPSAPGVSEEMMWAFSLPERTPIGPAIRYGSAPTGATVWTQPRALVRGVTYQVWVYHTVGGDGLLGSGKRVFTP